MSIPTAMIAMGGNSISPKGEAGTIQQQFSHTRETVEGISHFIERGYNLCITTERFDPNSQLLKGIKIIEFSSVTFRILLTTL